MREARIREILKGICDQLDARARRTAVPAAAAVALAVAGCNSTTDDGDRPSPTTDALVQDSTLTPGPDAVVRYAAPVDTGTGADATDVRTDATDARDATDATGGARDATDAADADGTGGSVGDAVSVYSAPFDGGFHADAIGPSPLYALPHEPHDTPDARAPGTDAVVKYGAP